VLNKHDVQPDFDTTATVPVCDEYILRPKRRSSSLPDRRGIAGEAHELPLTDGHTAVVFVREGKALVGADGAEKKLGPQDVAVLDRSGDSVRIVAGEKGTKLLVLAGEPINEPIAARGPFVMNTMEEIRQANEDFYSGRLGR